MRTAGRGRIHRDATDDSAGSGAARGSRRAGRHALQALLPHSTSSSGRSDSSAQAEGSRSSGTDGSAISARCALPDHRTPVFFEATHDGCVVRVARPRACVDHDIDRRQFMLVLSKRFANEPLDAIASHGVADDPRGDRESEARDAAVIAAREDRKRAVGGAARVTIHAIEFGFGLETLRRFERPGGCLQVDDRGMRPGGPDFRRSGACALSRGGEQAPDVRRG
jgi:hypothetical protein